MRTIKAEPKASVLIESMRDIGYSLETALADLVDNSIAAGASTVRLFSEMGDSLLRIGILDDGSGMTEAELFDAMRPGSRSPREQRAKADLGRFGLGLKTASFSQCRRVTVVTRQNSAICAARWDLDHVAETDEWLVQIPDDPASIPWSSMLGNHGTLVVWEKLDRITDSSGLEANLAHSIQRLDDAFEHLELVFHRFLSGESGHRKVRISFNDRPLVPFDPFNSGHPATIVGPVEKIKVGDETVTVQAYTLPHHQKISAAEWERYAGREGYVKNQGFYVYRERRLIIHGTWFGLARQTELTKLARVRIDMPNGLDSDWKIDVRKASAQPPYQVRERLRRIIETIGATSKRVYTSRGRRLVSANRLPVWERVLDKGEISYRVNLEHPIFAAFASRLPSELGSEFKHVTEVIASALPMDALFADLGVEPEKVAGGTLTDETLEHAVRSTHEILLSRGLQTSEVADILQRAEPFRSNWERTEELLQQLDCSEGSNV